MEVGKSAGFDFATEENVRASHEISLVLDLDHQVPKGIEKLQGARSELNEVHLHVPCSPRGVPVVQLKYIGLFVWGDTVGSNNETRIVGLINQIIQNFQKFQIDVPPKKPKE